jgi:hypothetical protein
MTNADRVNYGNVVLMLVAALAALACPFELFLFAYAFLGPLHYLTEISWLHQRSYFQHGRYGHLVLLVACAVFVGVDYAGVSDATNRAVSTISVVGAFLASLALTTIVRKQWRIAAVALAFGVGYALSGSHGAQKLFLLFIPTIIHVYVFTAAFILLGALRTGTKSGWASLLAFVVFTGVVLLVGTPSTSPPPGEYVREAYRGFSDLNFALASSLGLGAMGAEADVFTSSAGVRVQRFIAFAYTYHYLNWFSKTSIIQWYRIPRAWAIVNFVVWVLSVGLYLSNFRIGLAVLFGLSFSHVVLEFPLNHRTFLEIVDQLRGRASGSATTASRA